MNPILDNLIIYTDGSCLGNPGPGGSAILVLKNSKEVYQLVEGSSNTTNNRMELIALLNSLIYLNKNPFNSTIIYSDSKYCLDPLIKNWISSWKAKNFKKVKNDDLWKQVIPLYENIKDKLSLNWVKGHSGNQYNEIVDQLANNKAKEYQLNENK